MHAKALLFILTLSIVSVLCVSCSSTSSKPQPGTPGFYWAAASETFTSGDYLKTADNLDRAMKSSEFEAKALPWALVLNAGMVNGYMEIADDFDKGARANRNNPTFFRKQTSNARRLARPLTLEFGEKFLAFQKDNKDEQIVLAFPFPSGSPAEPAAMGHIIQGMILPDAQLQDAQRLMMSRAMILAAADAAGVGEDSSKALELFKSGELKVPRATFMLAMAHALSISADLYNSKRLDESDRARSFSEMALAALKGVPSTLEVKALTEKLEKTVKSVKNTTT